VAESPDVKPGVGISQKSCRMPAIPSLGLAGGASSVALRSPTSGVPRPPTRPRLSGRGSWLGRLDEEPPTVVNRRTTQERDVMVKRYKRCEWAGSLPQSSMREGEVERLGQLFMQPSYRGVPLWALVALSACLFLQACKRAQNEAPQAEAPQAEAWEADLDSTEFGPEHWAPGIRSDAVKTVIDTACRFAFNKQDLDLPLFALGNGQGYPEMFCIRGEVPTEKWPLLVDEVKTFLSENAVTCKSKTHYRLLRVIDYEVSSGDDLVRIRVKRVRSEPADPPGEDEPSDLTIPELD